MADFLVGSFVCGWLFCMIPALIEMREIWRESFLATWWYRIGLQCTFLWVASIYALGWPLWLFIWIHDELCQQKNRWWKDYSD